MCRSKDHGGRRCPKSETTKARERAASRRYYARKKTKTDAAHQQPGRIERLRQHGFADGDVARTRSGSRTPSALIEQYRPWLQSLSDEERDAVERYTRFAYKVNDQLREGVSPDSLPRSQPHFVKHLDAALAKAPQGAEPQTVYRGMMFLNEGEDRVRSWAEDTFVPDSTVEFPAYVSTTSDPTVAMGFAHQDESVVFEMRARSGGHVAEMSAFPPECEHLIGRGSRWRVVDVTHDVPMETESGELDRRTMVHLVEL